MLFGFRYAFWKFNPKKLSGLWGAKMLRIQPGVLHNTFRAERLESFAYSLKRFFDFMVTLTVPIPVQGSLIGSIYF